MKFQSLNIRKLHIKSGLNSTSTGLFGDFLGVGYDLYQVRPKVLLVFNKRKTLADAWNKIVKWWPDEEIRMRFVEKFDSFEYVLFGKSNILDTQWIFRKLLRSSEHYQKFKHEYDGVVYLGFALYHPQDDSYELEIFDYKKKITDVRFLNEESAEQDSTVLKARELQHVLEEK